MKNLIAKVNEFVFGWGSPVTFGLIRIVFGFLALVNFLMISIDFEAWFTEKGFVNVWHAEKWAQGVPRLNFLAGVTDARTTATLYIILCISCLFTCLGLWTRISTIVMFLLIVTFHHRNPEILHSGDTLLRQMAFLIMIAPSGHALSLDRWFKIRKISPPPEIQPVSLWPLRLMQYQVTIVYFTTVWHKWTGTHWRDGTATWFVPQLHEFDRFPSPAFVDQAPFVQITTYLTLLIELGIAFLAYNKKWRKYVLWSGVLLHASIEYRFNIPLFSFIMTATYISFFYGEEVSAWLTKVEARLGFAQRVSSQNFDLEQGIGDSGKALVDVK